MHPRNLVEVFNRGINMDSVANISAEAAVSASAHNLMMNAMAVMCGLTLVVMSCMVTNGLDVSAGFF